MGKKHGLILALISALCLSGFFFRLKMASFFPHLPREDEMTYALIFPRNIEKHFLYAHNTSKTYVFPMIVAVIYKLFGNFNFTAIVTFQAILDTLTGLLVFLLGLKIFKDKKVSLVLLTIYLFNPLTASFTAVYLSDMTGVFLFVLLTYIFFQKRSSGQGFLFGLILGLFTFTRMIFWWFSISLLLIYLGKTLFPAPKKIPAAFLAILGFSLTMIYPLAANWNKYRLFTPLPVIPDSIRVFIQAVDLHKTPALIEENMKYIPYDKQVLLPPGSFDDPVKYRKNIRPELDRALRKILDNPLKYFLDRFLHMWNMWDKTSLFYYQDRFYPADRPVLQIANLLFLSLASVGIVRSLIKKGRSKEENKLLLIVLLIVFYLTIPFSVFLPEERYTLPTYPLLLLFVPGGVDILRRLFVSLNLSL